MSAFAALGQATRLEAFRLLIRAGAHGLGAGEIARGLDVRQNTLSANLAVLLQARLIRNRREGRHIRYYADMDGVRALLGFLLQDCCGGVPETCAPLLASLFDNTKGPTMSRDPDTPLNVLFLCTANSARSILAEGVLRNEGTPRFRAFSAGSTPSGTVHPDALDVLRREGIDTGFARSKSWDEFATGDAPEMDLVITVCDNAAGEVCPVWPGQPVTAHWSLPDPAKATGTDAERRLAFAEVYRMARNRIGLMTALPVEALDALTLKKRVTEIGVDAAAEAPA